MGKNYEKYRTLLKRKLTQRQVDVNSIEKSSGVELEIEGIKKTQPNLTDEQAIDVIIQNYYNQVNASVQEKANNVNTLKNNLTNLDNELEQKKVDHEKKIKDLKAEREKWNAFDPKKIEKKLCKEYEELGGELLETWAELEKTVKENKFLKTDEERQRRLDFLVQDKDLQDETDILSRYQKLLQDKDKYRPDLAEKFNKDIKAENDAYKQYVSSYEAQKEELGNSITNAENDVKSAETDRDNKVKNYSSKYQQYLDYKKEVAQIKEDKAELDEDERYLNFNALMAMREKAVQDYNNTSLFSRILRWILPNSWSEAGRIQDEIDDMDKALKEENFTKKDFDDYYKRKEELQKDNEVSAQHFAYEQEVEGLDKSTNDRDMSRVSGAVQPKNLSKGDIQKGGK